MRRHRPKASGRSESTLMRQQSRPVEVSPFGRSYRCVLRCGHVRLLLDAARRPTVGDCLVCSLCLAETVVVGVSAPNRSLDGLAIRDQTNQVTVSQRDRLTARELRAVRLVASGRSPDQVADEMAAPPAEIACILWSACRKLGVTDPAEAVRAAALGGYF